MTPKGVNPLKKSLKASPGRYSTNNPRKSMAENKKEEDNNDSEFKVALK